MAIRFLTEKYNTQRKRHFKYYNLILMILFAGLVAFVLIFTKKEKSFREKENNSSLTETINIQLIDK